ncbi:HNH endonuclease signature motif containing protein [Rhodoferax ferrireducens]|uniref:HNH endonuclease signature motif containing protein n=1 Tax=Rhodoferax ferrireducens TaxID=192843 RepID=UPI000E0D609A|nr:HNH endonuclease signature motif containing protein [Rhodoferax ferrireducens]
MLRTLILFLLLAISAAADARSAREVLAFKRANPCPSTGERRGACPGFQVDHTIALCAGGPDLRSNMAWLSIEDHRFKTFTDVRECRKLRKLLSK